MVLRMSRPVRLSHTSYLSFRKRIPADLRNQARGQVVRITFPAHGADPEHTATATLGATEVKFSLRTRDPDTAKARTGIAEGHLQRLFQNLRAGGRLRLPISRRWPWQGHGIGSLSPGMSLNNPSRDLMIDPDRYFILRKGQPQDYKQSCPWHPFKRQGTASYARPRVHP